MFKKDFVRKELIVENDTYSWKSYDGLNLFGQSWKANEKPKGIINLIHGFGEHSSRYNNWANELVKNGYYVISLDLRGHGRSEGKRGFAPSYRKLIKDIEVLFLNSEKIFPQLPKYIYGHSFGGNLAVNFLLQNPNEISGLILTSPWFELTMNPNPLKLFFASILKQFLPNYITTTDLNPEYLSRNKEVINHYKNDPLVHNKISLKLFFEIIDAGQVASKSIYKLNMPILVMHGNADNITSIKASKNFVMNASANTSFKEWNDCYHELHNDIDSEEVFTYIVEWLKKINTNLKNGIQHQS